VAGNGTATYSGDGVQATGTGLSPGNVAVDASGNLYIADSGNYRVYKVTTATGVITTVAGTGIEGYTGDNGPATVAELFPQRVAVDASGNLYISGGPYSIVRAVSFGKATPVITWPEPAPINYGTSLSANQLNASSTVPGTYVYSLANGTVVTPGTVLPAGTYTLNATLIPNSLVNCNSATATVTLTVYRSTPVVAWTTPAPIPNGTALSYATQLNAVLSVPANTSATIYSPAAGTILPPGDHLLSVTMTPLDTADYNSVTAVVPITVLTGSTYDTGAVMLKVEGTTIATTTYVAGATPSTIAEGLAAYVASNPNSLVNVTAVGDAVYIEATPAAVSAYGSAGTNFPYSIQNSGYDLQHFSYPSFPGSTISGSLEGSASTDSTTTPVYSFTRSYDPLGNLTSYTDSVMGTFNFVTGSGASGYDTLNRLSAGTLTPPSGSNQAPQSFCWSYDGFGNRITQATSNQPFSNAAGATTCQLANSGTLLSNAWTNQSAANNNRLAGASAAPGGVAYDASGDVTYDGQNQYLYDGDGRICAVASTPIPGMTTMTGYVYDASGTRVAKGTIITWSCDPAVNGFQTTSDYVLGPSGEQITEMGMDTNSNGNAMAWQHTNVWAGGSLIATYDNDGLHFYFNDPLGTRRVQTDYAGVIEQTCQSLPYGDGLSCTGSAQYPTEHHFTGKERDAESGNDYFDARYYTSTMGRWMSPDWSATEEPVPYAKMDNPQSLNLYAYLNNNPLLTFDPDGHQDPCVRQGTDNCPNVGKDPAPAKSAAQMAQKQATVPVTVDQVTANNPFGHSVIGVGGDKPVGLVPDSAAAAAGAVAIQAEEQQVLGVPLPQSVPGHIQPVEADQKVKNSATINVTPKQAAAMRAFINDAAAHPQRYDAVFHNCAQFTQQVLRAGGVILPRDLTPGGVVDDLRKQQ
jgi:RHS repeat-associated protein